MSGAVVIDRNTIDSTVRALADLRGVLAKRRCRRFDLKRTAFVSEAIARLGKSSKFEPRQPNRCQRVNMAATIAVNGWSNAAGGGYPWLRPSDARCSFASIGHGDEDDGRGFAETAWRKETWPKGLAKGFGQTMF